MKKLMVLVGGGLLAVAIPAAADTETVGGYTWTYLVNGNTAEICRPKPYYGPTTPTTTALLIPSVLGGALVTSIGEYAFSDCDWLANVTMLNNVRSIGDHAFEGCSRLASVTIPDSVTSIGDDAFSGCSGLGGVTIGSGVTSIGDGAFSGCSGLASVTIPDSVTSIGRWAFSECSGLRSVTIGNGVKSIGGWAFRGCGGLTSVAIPNSVESLGQDMFSGCRRLRNVTLPAWCQITNVYASSDCRLGSEYRLTGESLSESESIRWQEYLGIPSGAKISYAPVECIPSGEGELSERWHSAQILDGVVRNGANDDVTGIIQIKIGKVNRDNVALVSGTITGLDRKKMNAKGGKFKVMKDDGREFLEAVLTAKDGTTIKITIDGNSFRGEWGDAYIEQKNVGGDWMRANAKVYVSTASAPLPAGTMEELLPDGEPVIVKDGAWTFNRATTVKLARDKTKAEWDTSKGRTNLSAMKLIYAPKTGQFKGSFKVYVLEEAFGGKKKLKKYAAAVTGVVVDGRGYGQAEIKKPAAGPWPVTVE